VESPFALLVGAPSNPDRASLVSYIKDQHDECRSAAGSMQYSGAHTINLQPDDAKDEEFFQNSIVPRLEMNHISFGAQRRALKRAGLSISGQLLGRALHAVRYNPNLLFRFLSENVPAFVRSDGDGPIITSGQK
jgi:hypothetical protein